MIRTVPEKSLLHEPRRSVRTIFCAKTSSKNQGTLGNPIWIPSFTWVLQALSKLRGSGPTHTFATPDKTSYLAHINHALQKMSSHERVLLPLLFLHLSVSIGKHPPKSIPPSPRFTIKCSFYRIPWHWCSFFSALWLWPFCIHVLLFLSIHKEDFGVLFHFFDMFNIHEAVNLAMKGCSALDRCKYSPTHLQRPAQNEQHRAPLPSSPAQPPCFPRRSAATPDPSLGW